MVTYTAAPAGIASSSAADRAGEFIAASNPGSILNEMIGPLVLGDWVAILSAIALIIRLAIDLRAFEEKFRLFGRLARVFGIGDR